MFIYCYLKHDDGYSSSKIFFEFQNILKNVYDKQSSNNGVKTQL